MLNDFMSRGKISNAIRFLSDEHKGGVLTPTDLIDGRPVLETLRDKHPEEDLKKDCQFKTFLRMFLNSELIVRL